jgi:hypothetical protein
MYRLVQAVLLNNEGASLLQSGRYLNAALWIRRAALVAIKGVAATDYPVLFALDATSDTFVLLDSNGSRFHDEATLLLEIGGQHAHPRHPPKDEALFMYRHPLVLPTHMHIASLDDYEWAMHMVQCGILFNQALASHLLGLSSTRDVAAKAVPLALAFELYHVLLEDVDWEYGRSILNISMNNALWQCIILNNLAHLHHELFEFDQSTYCLNCVREIMVQTHCLDTFEHICADDAQDIKLNVILPQFCKNAPVA